MPMALFKPFTWACSASFSEIYCRTIVPSSPKMLLTSRNAKPATDILRIDRTIFSSLALLLLAPFPIFRMLCSAWSPSSDASERERFRAAISASSCCNPVWDAKRIKLGSMPSATFFKALSSSETAAYAPRKSESSVFSVRILCSCLAWARSVFATGVAAASEIFLVTLAISLAILPRSSVSSLICMESGLEMSMPSVALAMALRADSISEIVWRMPETPLTAMAFFIFALVAAEITPACAIFFLKSEASTPSRTIIFLGIDAPPVCCSIGYAAVECLDGEVVAIWGSRRSRCGENEQIIKLHICFRQ